MEVGAGAGGAVEHKPPEATSSEGSTPGWVFPAFSCFIVLVKDPWEAPTMWLWVRRACMQSKHESALGALWCCIDDLAKLQLHVPSIIALSDSGLLPMHRQPLSL